MKRVFPEIRALCRQRGITFTEIDLRWGVTELEESLGRVIRVCFDEIDRCRPYFIGITGDRYGWVPTVHDVYKDPELIAEHPWIEDAVAQGWSIMEMECEYGALRTPSASTAAFYVRNRFFPPEHEERRHNQSNESPFDSNEAGLIRLKRKILESGHLVQRFQTVEQLGTLVFDNLSGILERDFPRETAGRPVNHERANHQAFARNRRRAYVPNSDYARRLTEFANAGKPGKKNDRASESPSGEVQVPVGDRVILVQGESGSGKSALLSYWAELYRRRNRQTLLIEHYVGVGSISHNAVFRHIILEIQDYLEVDEPSTDLSKDLAHEFSVWLSRLHDRHTVIVIDGINQFDPADQTLMWLPRFVPATATFVISTTATGDAAIPLSSGHELSTLHVGFFDANDIEAVTVAFLSSFRKALPPGLTSHISSAPQTAHPLFLRTLLEELRLFGFHEQLSSIVHHYLQAESTPELFQLVLSRLENDFEHEPIRQVLSHIALSRHGLTMFELMSLTELARKQLNQILLALDYHVFESGGLYSVSHQFLTEAIQSRYLKDTQTSLQLRRTAADYFASCTDVQRRTIEQPWQLLQIGHLEELAAAITDRSLLNALLDTQHRLDLSRYLDALRDIQSTRTLAKHIIRSTRCRVGSQEHDIQSTVVRSVDFLIYDGNLVDAEWLLRTYHAMLNRHEPDTISLSKIERKLGDVLYIFNDWKLAEIWCLRALSRLDDAIASRHLSIERIDTLSLLGAILVSLVQLEPQSKSDLLIRADRAYAEALDLLAQLTNLDDAEELYTELLNNLAAVKWRRGEYTDSISLTGKALAHNVMLHGECHLSVAANYNNLSLYYRRLRDFHRACQHGEKALAIYEVLTSPTNGQRLICEGNLGVLYRLVGRFDRSEQVLLSVLERRLQLYGSDHRYTSDTRYSLGILYAEKRDTENALHQLTLVHEDRCRRCGENHPDTVEVKKRLDHVHAQIGRH